MAVPYFDITPQDPKLQNLKDKVILITGCSSGIGLATSKLCLSLGAKVVGGDLNPAPLDQDDKTFVFQKTDVTSWPSQLALFEKAIETFGRIDHVFANAGIGGTDNFCTDVLDADGKLMPPNMKTMDINLTGCIYTCKLGVHYLRRNGEGGGSVVMTASGSSFSPFVVADYGVAKHGVLGLMRNLHQNLIDTPIRSNCITPLWTATGLVPAKLMEEKLGIISQPAETVACAVALLMADGERNGQTILSKQGRHKEVDKLLLKTVFEFTEPGKGDGPEGAAGGLNQKKFMEMMASLGN